ncbi:MAG: hypothetical protein COB83_08010 [Gammaproteobacteria bacterium]|nr:MAG: hypothetical protein COB83_08010 [Gammaproteobacteria bacterium]
MKLRPKKIKAFFSGNVFTSWLAGGKRKMRLTKTLTFTDKNNKEWKAPRNSIIDGASIPRLFWLFIGSPFVGKYRRASVVHDVYYGTKSEPRKQVDKMFYQAMRVDKVNYFKAKAMYYAVRVGGKRW